MADGDYPTLCAPPGAPPWIPPRRDTPGRSPSLEFDHLRAHLAMDGISAAAMVGVDASLRHQIPSIQCAWLGCEVVELITLSPFFPTVKRRRPLTRRAQRFAEDLNI